MNEIFRYGEKEVVCLKKIDRASGKIIDKIGHIEREVTPDLFASLGRSIVARQISSKSDAIIGRRMSEPFK